MSLCDDIEQRLTEDGLDSLTQDEQQRHIDNCPRCQNMIAGLKQLEASLSQLPVYDAPGKLLSKTQSAVARTESPTKQQGLQTQRRWAAGLGMAAVILAVIGLDPMTHYQQFVPSPLSLSEPALDAEGFVTAPGLDDSLHANQEPLELNRPDVAAPEPEEKAKRERSSSTARQLRPDSELSPVDQDGLSSQPSGQAAITSSFAQQNAQLATRRTEQAAGSGGAFADSSRDAQPKQRELSQMYYRDAIVGGELAGPDEPEPLITQTETQIIGRLEGRLGGRADAKPDVPGAGDYRAGEDKEHHSAPAQSKRPMPQDAAEAANGKKPTPASIAPMLSSAQAFLRQRESLENLSFQPATGYWANTYIPGDPVLRRLQAQLSGWGRPFEARLEQHISANRQPFDPPENAAIALYLHADKKAIDGPSRLRLQVGLKGALRRAGQRPALNIGVVLDLRGADRARYGPSIRAVLNALAQAKQAGDRFSLTVAGPAGGLILPPEQFRHGPLSLSLSRLLLEPPPPGQPSSLAEAFEQAGEQVAVGDDPDAPLGSSMLLLIATAPINAELAELERIAHANALAGIQLSALTVGAYSEPSALQTLVLAGQGNLRSLSAPDQAKAVIEQELFSSSRAVARALRLRIRLAPEVKLIDILGSYRLDDPAAQRVREAEQSIDQRLARNLGIQADRGEDEEGLQIIIPQFHAEAEHVILLDVVVPGAGPVADVRLRYKDLVYARNNSASAQLTLAAGAQPPGPLERNVIKNQLAYLLTQALQQAAGLVAQNPPQALAALAQMQVLLQELRQTFPAWRNDPELLADEQLLAGYTRAIKAIGPAETPYLTASLRYAAYHKLLGEPLSE